ncbi:TrbI/VirB10 family protein [Brevundimonas sp. NPDC092305]|uniref:TrbI/VirB10 family protein n=1 Tax=Brevundimonas sp. NPDC092305 TaxID=3363957 RepID=UPI00382BAF83
MTAVDPETGPPVAPKAPPPLMGRAERPTAVRLRGGVVKAIVAGGAVLLSGSLAWAFVVQPELRAEARERKAESRPETGRGAVRPAETVTDQPASYDRLPPPKGMTEAPEVAGEAGTAWTREAPSAWREPTTRTDAVRPAGPRPGDLARTSGLFFAASPGAASPARAPAAAAPQSRATGIADGVYNPHALVGPVSPFELKAGAIVSAALLTAVDTSREGPVVAMVTQNVFDTVTGRHLLLPQGTRLIGVSGGDGVYGERRAFVTWERLILPNGRSLQLSEAGVDAQGAVGVRGQVDRRLLQMLGAVVLSGAVTTLGQIARDNDRAGSGSLLGDVGDAAAIEGSRIGGRLVDRELEVRPSIRLRPGAPVNVLITRDLILEPYAS